MQCSISILTRLVIWVLVPERQSGHSHISIDLVGQPTVSGHLPTSTLRAHRDRFRSSVPGVNINLPRRIPWRWTINRLTVDMLVRVLPHAGCGTTGNTVSVQSIDFGCSGEDACTSAREGCMQTSNHRVSQLPRWTRILVIWCCFVQS